MELLIRSVFCLVVVAEHWANAGHDMVFGDPLGQVVPRPKMMLQKIWGLPANQGKPPGPIFIPLPTPRPPMFGVKHQKPADYYPSGRPPLYPPVRPPGYPVYKPWRVPTNAQVTSGPTQSTQPTQPTQPNPSQLPSKAPAYWFKVPSYNFNFGKPKYQIFASTVAPPATKPPNYPFLPVPGHLFPPYKKPVGQGFVNYRNPQKVTKLPHDVKGPKMSDYPVYPNYPPYVSYNVIPSLPGYYFYSLYPPPHHPPPRPATKMPEYSVKGPPVLQKQEMPKLQWSPEEQRWISFFSSR